MNNPTNLTDPSGMMQGVPGWSEVSAGFWGSYFDPNQSHFAGPEVIAGAGMADAARTQTGPKKTQNSGAMYMWGQNSEEIDVIEIETKAFYSREEYLRYFRKLYNSPEWTDVTGGAEGISRPNRGFGWGFTGSGHTFAGIGVVGGGGTGGGFVGQFTDGQRMVSGGGLQGGALAYITAGARAVSPRGIVSAPEIADDESATVVGASAGGGVGLFFTNAGTPEDLRGPRQLNTPWFGAQYDTSGGVRVFSLTFGQVAQLWGDSFLN